MNRYFSALAALSILTADQNYVPVGRNISDDVNKPLDVPNAYKAQPKPLSKKQKAKLKKKCTK